MKEGEKGQGERLEREGGREKRRKRERRKERGDKIEDRSVFHYDKGGR